MMVFGDIGEYSWYKGTDEVVPWSSKILHHSFILEIDGALIPKTFIDQ